MSGKEYFSGSFNQIETNYSRKFETGDIPVKNLDINPENFKTNFLKRKDKFLSFYKHETTDILSKKFYLNDFNFEISIHIFPEDIFSNMINENLLKDLSSNENKVHLLHDYKDNHFPHQKCCQKSFSDKTYEFVVPVKELIDGSNVTTLPGYIISNSEFYPGIYQNLISPIFSVYLDNDEGKLTSKVNFFKKIMVDRLHKERLRHKDNKFQFSHARQNFFHHHLPIY